jgi:hypothetical protein
VLEAGWALSAGTCRPGLRGPAARQAEPGREGRAHKSSPRQFRRDEECRQNIPSTASASADGTWHFISS